MEKGSLVFFGNQLTVSSFIVSVMKDKNPIPKALLMGTLYFYKISNTGNNGQHFFLKATCYLKGLSMIFVELW